MLHVTSRGTSAIAMWTAAQIAPLCCPETDSLCRWPAPKPVWSRHIHAHTTSQAADANTSKAHETSTDRVVSNASSARGTVEGAGKLMVEVMDANTIGCISIILIVDYKLKMSASVWNNIFPRQAADPSKRQVLPGFADDKFDDELSKLLSSMLFKTSQAMRPNSGYV
ncbi:hypothetical protein PoB_001583700 [Plakobranchus ocellatus]|uniref:Uncharacterized protein n=1 Tax=Plakobranchus ocellatus TaxID=259542 RepID=A0AAV3Z4B6_9GAST|nr:hypothetical protein PoB_001583700 [Plakobranchus ocellatus]